MKRTLTFDYDDNVLAALGMSAEEFSAEAKLLIAVKLYELGHLSSGAASEMAEIPKPVFLQKLAELGVNTFGSGDDELARDLDSVRRHQ